MSVEQMYFSMIVTFLCFEIPVCFRHESVGPHPVTREAGAKYLTRFASVGIWRRGGAERHVVPLSVSVAASLPVLEETGRDAAISRTGNSRRDSSHRPA